VGSILGVTKEVDMVFTRRFEVNRLQVMVVNPNLIPEVVNVVIGDNLYELKFCVEHQMDSSNPQPMEMDNDHYADEGERQMGNKQGANSMNNLNSNTAARKSGEQRERGKDHSRVSEIKQCRCIISRCRQVMQLWVVRTMGLDSCLSKH
jgi:hypothetical protein